MSGLEDKPENYAIVTYQLSGADGNVDLIVTQENIPDEKTKAHSLENWKKVVEGLKAIMEKIPETAATQTWEIKYCHFCISRLATPCISAD